MQPPPASRGEAWWGVARQQRRGAGERPPALIALLALCGTALFVLPLVGLVIKAPWPEALADLRAPESLDALRLSLICSLSATVIAIVLGVPLAWVQARMRFRGQNVLRALTTLPMVLPPVVGGVALLLAFGRRGLIGSYLFDAYGIRLPFTTAGVILAETFVSMPFLVITVEAGLRSMNRRLEEAARSLGARPWTVFLRVTLPLIAPSISAGAILCWSRALGEFGATITFVSNIPGQTQTLPTLIYTFTQVPGGDAGALRLTLISLAISLTAILASEWLAREVGRRVRAD
ncbi:MAG TPA: molybdate ABC transporter permease subunit [Rhizobiales bacterium]|nr:molybdate ABC transporter permease subunit [Hyphomicrobiales bacterium]